MDSGTRLTRARSGGRRAPTSQPGRAKAYPLLLESGSTTDLTRIMTSYIAIPAATETLRAFDEAAHR